MRAIWEPSMIATPTPSDGSYNGATDGDEASWPWNINHIHILYAFTTASSDRVEGLTDMT